MKLTARSEYALLAMLFLARQKPGLYVSEDELALDPRIPPDCIRLILAALEQSRYVQASRQSPRAFRLAKAPEKIFLAEIVRLFDGALAPTESVSKYFYESTPIEKEARLIDVFRDIRDYVAARLETTSLADVC